MRTHRWALAFALLLLATAASAAAEPVRVLAAFTLKPALDAIAQDYRRAGGETVLVYGPSPALAQQIENGAPADVFFSADPAWTDELAKHRLVDPGGVAELIGNRLVLVARKGTVPPVAITQDLPLAKLIGNGPITMCDPDSHPAGKMAKASLTSLGLWKSVAGKVARAENPLLAVKMVARGDAPFAIVFATDAMAEDGVGIVGTFPDDSHPPIRYPAAVVATSRNPDATKFFAYLKSESATDEFRRFGYLVLR